jgi:hypothetical protein
MGCHIISRPGPKHGQTWQSPLAILRPFAHDFELVSYPCHFNHFVPWLALKDATCRRHPHTRGHGQDRGGYRNVHQGWCPTPRRLWPVGRHEWPMKPVPHAAGQSHGVHGPCGPAPCCEPRPPCGQCLRHLFFLADTAARFKRPLERAPEVTIPPAKYPWHS